MLDARDEEVCWGEVNVVDEEYTDDEHWWIHACQGHWSGYLNGGYEHEPPPATPR